METQNNELEVMRQQLAILNKKLDSQEIVNDRLMRQAMKNKMSWIRKYVWAEIIGIPLIILLFFVIAVWFKMSFGPLILMSVMLVIDVALDYKINKAGDRNLFQGNLTETAVKLMRMKRLRMTQLVAEMPILIIWAVWFFLDIFHHIPADGMMNGAMTAGLIGGAVGLVLGIVAAFAIVRKMQRTNDEVISQIQEITKE